MYNRITSFTAWGILAFRYFGSIVGSWRQVICKLSIFPSKSFLRLSERLQFLAQHEDPDATKIPNTSGAYCRKSKPSRVSLE